MYSNSNNQNSNAFTIAKSGSSSTTTSIAILSQNNDNDIWIDDYIDKICNKQNGKINDENYDRQMSDYQTKEYKLYTRRWFILIIFSLYSGSSAMHWLHYSIIGNIVQRYYLISDELLEWTSLVFLILYVVFMIPGSWFLEKMGLRWSVLFGAIINFTGSWLKVISVRQDLFLVGFIGHIMISSGQVFALSLPPKLGSVWFGKNEVAFACSFCIFGNQIGLATSFILPPTLVKNHEDVNLIGKDLNVLFYATAIYSTILLVIIFLFFQAKPPTPPSVAQEFSENLESTDIFPCLKRLMTNRNFVLLFISYGWSINVFYCLSTFLNQLVLLYNPGHEMDAGQIGFSMIFGGIFGAIICGIFLDKTHRYKEAALALCILSMISMWIFTFTLNTGNIEIVYVTGTLIATFLMGYLLVGLEFGVELTYPEPEGTSGGLLTVSTLLFSFIYTILYGKLLNNYGDQYANITTSLLLCICVGITVLIKNDLRRQAVQNNNNN